MPTIIQDILLRRNLVFELALKDLKARYSRPILGFLWIFLSPLLTVTIFYLVFSVILQVKIKEAPFFLYLMSAIFPWRFFQDSLVSSSASLIDNKNLIRESKFPHYLIPLSIVLANGINFLPSLFILIAASLFILKGLPVFILFLPIILAIHLIITTALSLIISLFYVKWRDTKYILEAILMLLFYITPVFYSISLVKDAFPPLLFKLYINNPFAGLLNLYRVSLLKGFYPLIKGEVGLFSLVIMPIGFVIVLLPLGIYFYKKNKDNINDYLSY